MKRGNSFSLREKGSPLPEQVFLQPEKANFRLKEADSLKTEKRHWNLGDVIERKLDGTAYRFQCIDQNYSDRMENHKPSALFLCMSVIPADLNSVYRWEDPGGYLFYPGPIVNFGEENDYKYSAVRAWLKSCEDGVDGALDIQTGVDFAYQGSTEESTFSQMDAGDLFGNYIGYQKMNDRLFCLSVDEALKYRDYLWKFEGSGEENPDSQYGPYSKGYWLRTPAGDQESFDTGMVYIVDLVRGTIRPQAVKPDGGGELPELNVTGTTGVRPAFALPQDS